METDFGSSSQLKALGELYTLVQSWYNFSMIYLVIYWSKQFMVYIDYGNIMSLWYCIFWRFKIWCYYIISSYFRLVSWWYGYQYLIWICMMTYWVYKLCSVVSGLYLQVVFMTWIWVVFSHWPFIIDTYLY